LTLLKGKFDAGMGKIRYMRRLGRIDMREYRAYDNGSVAGGHFGLRTAGRSGEKE
jgi:hypothetical protein